MPESVLDRNSTLSPPQPRMSTYPPFSRTSVADAPPLTMSVPRELTSTPLAKPPQPSRAVPPKSISISVAEASSPISSMPPRLTVAPSTACPLVTKMLRPASTVMPLADPVGSPQISRYRYSSERSSVQVWPNNSSVSPTEIVPSTLPSRKFTTVIVLPNPDAPSASMYEPSSWKQDTESVKSGMFSKTERSRNSASPSASTPAMSNTTMLPDSAKTLAPERSTGPEIVPPLRRCSSFAPMTGARSAPET